jgi:hypothetical protein
MEYFTLQMEDALTYNYIQPTSYVQPVTTHLLYADDVMIFLSATSGNTKAMDDSFNHLKNTVGLHINHMKSKMDFSKDVSNKATLLQIMGNTEDFLPIKYLVSHCPVIMFIPLIVCLLLLRCMTKQRDGMVLYYLLQGELSRYRVP